MTPNPRDLFGEVPVTWPDIELWMRAVPRMDPHTRRAARYITGYDVPNKIRAAKLAGYWHTIEVKTAPDRGAACRLPWEHIPGDVASFTA